MIMFELTGAVDLVLQIMMVGTSCPLYLWTQLMSERQ